MDGMGRDSVESGRVSSSVPRLWRAPRRRAQGLSCRRYGVGGWPVSASLACEVSMPQGLRFCCRVFSSFLQSRCCFTQSCDMPALTCHLTGSSLKSHRCPHLPEQEAAAQRGCVPCPGSDSEADSQLCLAGLSPCDRWGSVRLCTLSSGPAIGWPWARAEVSITEILFILSINSPVTYIDFI